MKIQNIDKFRTVIDKFNGQGQTIDDYLLDGYANKFYASREAAEMQEIIAYIRKKNTAQSDAFAGELEKRLQADVSAAPVPRQAPAAVPAVAPAPQQQAAVGVPPRPQAQVQPTVGTPPQPQTQAPQPATVPAPQLCVQRTDAEHNNPAAKAIATAGEKSQASKLTVPAAAALRNPGEIFLIEPDAEIKIHPLAAAMPLVQGEEFEQLKVSIFGGQQVPVLTCQGLLLDGRNRLRACQELGIAAKAVEFDREGTPVEAIIALNLCRRNLTASQRAAFAVKLLPALELEAAARRGARTDLRGKVSSGGKAVDLAGARVNVSAKYVRAAKEIADASPETYEKLLNGSATLSQAKKEIKVLAGDTSQTESKKLSVPAAIVKIVKLLPKELDSDMLAIAAEAIVKFVKMLPDECTDDILKIADEAPAAIREAIRSCFVFDDTPASEDTEEDAEVEDEESSSR